jgi:outer membrane protein TolC
VAAQHSPDLVNSVIALDLADLDARTSSLRRLPTVRLLFRGISNLTQKYPEYAGTSGRPSLAIFGYEPVVNYLTHENTLLLQEIALYTHEVALEKRAQQIAETLLRLEAKENERARLTALLEFARQSVEYQRASTGGPPDRLEEARALNTEKKAQVKLEKNSVEVSSLLTSLKEMIGLDLDRKLTVQADGVSALLREKKASASLAQISWEPVWENSPETLIHRASRNLAKRNVNLARARYLPVFSMEMFSANPVETYATYSSQDEVFLSLVWSLPLLDWGERSRGMEKRHLEVVQAMQRLKQARLKFSAEWKNTWQDLKMAEADVELGRADLAAAHLAEQKASLEYRGGRVLFSAVTKSGEDRIKAEMDLEDFLLELRLKELSAWFLSGGFRRDFLDLPASVRSGEKKSREDVL